MNSQLLEFSFWENPKFKKSLFALLLPILAASLFFIQPTKTFAANGARIGGSNFSAPSIPRTKSYNSFNSRGYRSNIGLPFFIPIYGLGGGAFGLLLLLGISGVIANTLRNNINSPSSESLLQKESQTSTLIQLQIALLSTAKNLKSTLTQLAQSANTSDAQGLKKVLEETSLAILRSSELWVYGNLEYAQIPIKNVENTFNKLSINERSKLKGESISNFSGKIDEIYFPDEQKKPEEQINEFIVVTILMASNQTLSIKDSSSSEGLKDSLKKIGSISNSDLLALEIIWQPEGDAEILSQEELVTSYPNLKHL